MVMAKWRIGWQPEPPSKAPNERLQWQTESRQRTTRKTSTDPRRGDLPRTKATVKNKPAVLRQSMKEREIPVGLLDALMNDTSNHLLIRRANCV